MYRLLESLAIRDGLITHVDYHQNRIEKAFSNQFPLHTPWCLSELFKNLELPQSGLYKLRFLYDSQNYHIEWAAYTPRNVSSLKLTEIGDYSYDHKFLDRDYIQDLFQKRGQADDILMVKHGCVTDTSYANIALLDQHNNWITPNKPLLEGTSRARLIAEEVISVKQILVNDLGQYKGVKPFNALMPLDDARPLIPIGHILNERIE